MATPTAGPWLSPQVVMVKSFPKLLGIASNQGVVTDTVSQAAKSRNPLSWHCVRHITVYKAPFFASAFLPNISRYHNPLHFMRPRFLCLALIFSLAALYAPALPPTAMPPGGPTPGANDEMINGLNLADAPIESVLQLLEAWTGRSILRPQALPAATYSININHALPKSEAVRALETLLGLNGVGVVPLGDKFLKIVPLPQASREAPELIEGSTLDLPPSGRIAAKLFQLKFLRVNEIIPPIQQIMSPGVASPPVLFESANAALIVDTISNLQRIELLIQNVDQPLAANLNPRFYQVHYAKASDLVNKLHSLFTGPLQNELGSATTYNADDRTNQIILLSDPRQYAFFDNLIAKLDIKSDPNTHNEVIYLKHAVAKDVASLLSQLITGQTSAAQKSGGGNTAAQPPPPSLNSLGVKGEGATEFSSYITVVPDDRSNAIVVSGTGDDIRLIQQVVDKIDILLAQVSIQVIIAEVTLDDSSVSGISQLNLTGGAAKNGGFDISSFGGTVGDWAVKGAAVTNPLAISAMMSGSNGQTTRSKILSADTVTTTHAKEADFVVSTQEPIITGTTAEPTGTTATTSTSSFATSSSVTYQNIGIEVKVTPLIGNDGSIQLTIDQKVDDLGGSVLIDGNSQPIINHREATSYVNIQNDQMVVLGGLQQHNITAAHTKLGWLWEIPIISNIFGQHVDDTKRTELLFFVRPHVIQPLESNGYTGKRIDELPNKEDINQFLKDPTKTPKQSLIDKYYRD
jgi:general secretion pathway protein D